MTFINFKKHSDAELELSIAVNCSSQSEASVCGVKTVALIHVSQISFDKKVCGVKWLRSYNKVIRGHVALRKSRRAYLGSWCKNQDRKRDSLIYSLIIFTLLFMLYIFIIKALFCKNSTENKPTTRQNI